MAYPSSVDSGTANASVSSDGAAIPSSSTLVGASDGTNLQQLLVESASHANLRTALYNAANELGIDSGGRVTVVFQVVGGTALAADQSNTELRTSVYGKATTAGDTPLLLDASGRPLVNVAQLNSTTIDTNSGTKSAGTQRVVIATDQPSLSNALAVSQSGTWTVQPGNTPNTSAWLVQNVVASANGSVPYHNITAATTNFTNVKGAAAQMYSCRLSNTSASVIYVKFYNKATTPGTGDTPKTTVQVPANSTVIGAFPEGMAFGTGFGWAATGGVGDSDNTAIAANCVVDFSLNS